MRCELYVQVKCNKIPYEFKSMIRQRDCLRAKVNKTGSCILRQAYNQMRTKVNQKLYLLRKNYYANKIEQHKDDLKPHRKFSKMQQEKTTKDSWNRKD